MTEKLEKKGWTRKKQFLLLMVMPLYFMVVGLALQPLGEIFPGLAALIREPDFLITDYFVIGGVGAAFMNAGLLTMLLLWLLYKMGVIVCSVKEAFELMKHMDENDMVVLSVVNKRTYVHDIPRRIKKKNGEELIKRADNIYYQDNDFFGTLSLYGVLQEKDTIHNILFPQLE